MKSAKEKRYEKFLHEFPFKDGLGVEFIAC